MKYYLLGLVCCLFLNDSFAQSPTSATIKPDGKFESSEWTDAKTLYAHDSMHILMKQDKDYLYIGFKLKTADPRYVDLFVTDGKALYDLHASFQTAQRLLPDTSFTDEVPAWNWGNNVQWKSNRVSYKQNADEKLPLRMQVNSYDGIEMVIRKNMFASENIAFFVEWKGFEDGIKAIHFPEKSNRKTEKTWFKLAL
jgi:hypothetical protein